MRKAVSALLLVGIFLTGAFYLSGSAVAQGVDNKCRFDVVARGDIDDRDQNTLLFHKCALEAMKKYNPPRLPSGEPDLQGMWGRPGPAQELEAYRDVRDPADFGLRRSRIVEPEDGKIPYQPWALTQRKVNLDKYISGTAFCFPSGPRYMYFGGSQILQRPGFVIMFQERFHQYRIIPTDGRPHVGSGVRLWNGDSRGRWEGNTLVVDVTNFNGLMTFDHAMNFATQDLHMIERFTPVDPDTIHWEATFEDPKVFTRPWKIAMALRRDGEANGPLDILEESCHEGSESVGDKEPFYRSGFNLFPGITGPPR